MNKEQILAKLKEAEDHCRDLFDQLQTINQQQDSVTVELERSRGDYRTLKQLAADWQNNLPVPDDSDIPEEDKKLAEAASIKKPAKPKE